MPLQSRSKPRSSRRTSEDSPLFIGLDLGGTNIKAGVVNARGQVLAQTSIPTGTTPKERQPGPVIARMAQAARQAMALAEVPDNQIKGVGITSPGEVHVDKGVVARIANLPAWRDVKLTERVPAALRLRVRAHLENDGKAAAYGEWWAGAGRDSSTMVIITLGSGVGGGVVRHGELIRGTYGLAGEVGHMILIPGGEQCGCGQRGCVEQYCSAHYFAQRAMRQLKERPHLLKESSLGRQLEAEGVVSSADIERHAKAGDGFSRDAWLEFSRYLAIACVNIARVVDPDMIVFAGGLVGAGNYLLQPVREHFKANWWKMSRSRMQILLSTLNNNAGIIGAAGLAAWQREHAW
jgi:glucokinase